MATPRKDPKDHKKDGPKEKYKAEYVDKAYRFCLLGCTNEQLAEIFNISVSTLHEWMKKYPKLSDAMYNGRDGADAEVVRSLYQRAKGYTCPETKAQYIFGEDGGQWVYAEMKKHYPPDTAAASLWLRNRQSARWRDKVENQLTGPEGGPLIVQVVKFADDKTS